MTPRRLRLSDPAIGDLVSRGQFLARERGEAFADAYVTELIGKLRGLASTGAQIGTAFGDDPTVRSFGYKRQATVIAQFSEGELLVLRVYFKGQDWSFEP